MYKYEFPRPAVTVDLVAFSVDGGQLRVLLVRRSTAPFAGRWTLPGGFVHDNEPLEASATRVLSAKAEVSDVYLEQLYTFGDPKRDPRDRVISVAYFAILNPSQNYDGPGTWFDVTALPELGFDHTHIVDTAVQRLRAKLTYSDIGFVFMPAEFTLGELQRNWETILGRPLDKRNFRKAIISKKRVLETGKKSVGGAHPPAKLYMLAHDVAS
ncbi:MAG: NUDIX domain-containing protein [Candidatus Latescibacteria bacterium]|nr:NUDIX domain-containing protein [Candidatus Latescibacterota bacterium]